MQYDYWTEMTWSDWYRAHLELRDKHAAALVELRRVRRENADLAAELTAVADLAERRRQALVTPLHPSEFTETKRHAPAPRYCIVTHEAV